MLPPVRRSLIKSTSGEMFLNYVLEIVCFGFRRLVSIGLYFAEARIMIIYRYFSSVNNCKS